MSTVYVVTSGSYSDYGIHAMFSTKKLAQEYIDKAKDSASYEYWAIKANIEEWKLDSESKAQTFDLWHVGLLLDDGSVVEPNRGSRSVFGVKCKSLVRQCGDKVPCYKMRPIVRVESSVSAEHAMKIAVEARQAWLRKENS